MRRSAAQGLRRTAVSPQARFRLREHHFHSPKRGWVTNVNLSEAIEDGAIVLDNWFPTKTGVRLRGGFQEYFDGGDGDPIISMWTYKVSGVSELFASDGVKIWDITSTPSTEVTGLGGGYISTQQMETGGGNYQYIVNGTDSPRLYDGATFTTITGVSTPAITGVTTSTLSHVWAYKNRLYFVQGGTMVAWYLPIDSVGGAASDHTLRGVFQRGGALLFGSTWSVDAGAGIDDYCVFVSDKGEVAVYSGDDPGASNWALVGRYDLGGIPLGKNATMRAGGDLIIATSDGFIPLSATLKKDPIALSLDAVSFPIEPDWRQEANDRISLPWEVEKWPEKNMAVITNPVVDATTSAQCFVVNLETGAWARYTGPNARSLAHHNEAVYFGTSDGRVMLMESEANDDGAVYVAKLAWHFSDLGLSPGWYKSAKQARALFRAGRPFTPQLSCSVDYGTSFPSPPNSVSDFVVDTWDSGLWDTAVWDGATSETTSTTRWQSVVGSGYAHSPQIQVTCGTTPLPDAELMELTITFEAGQLVV